MLFEITSWEERYLVEKECLPAQFKQDCKEAVEAYRKECLPDVCRNWASPCDVVDYLCEKLWYKEVRAPRECVVFCPHDLNYEND